MKKLTLILAACVIALSANAQFDLKNLTYGVKAGMNLANITGTDKLDMKVSYYLGGSAEYQLNDLVGIAGELVYSRQGTTGSHVEGIDYTFRINYLNLPILAKLYVMDNLSVDLGPQFGYALSQTEEITVAETGYNSSNDTSNKKFDVSFGMGATYSFGKIAAQARYNLGLINIGTDEKNSVIQLGLAYNF